MAIVSAVRHDCGDCLLTVRLPGVKHAKQKALSIPVVAADVAFAIHMHSRTVPPPPLARPTPRDCNTCFSTMMPGCATAHVSFSDVFLLAFPFLDLTRAMVSDLEGGFRASLLNNNIKAA